MSDPIWWIAGLALLVVVAAIVYRPRKPSKNRIEVRYLPYDVADALMKHEKGWQIAPEEDTNTRLGWVWLEKVE